MSAPTAWTPLGCGAASMRRGEASAGVPDYPCDLASRADELDLGVEAVFLAWEIAGLARASSPEQRRSLILLMLAAQMAGAEGSTRLSLAPGGRLDRALGELSACPDERARVHRLLGEAAEAATSAKGDLAAVIGGPGAYRPLIVDHDCIYIQKLHVLEQRVGSALSLRMKPAGSDGRSGRGRLPAEVEAAAGEVFGEPPIESFGKVALDDEQREAVLTALTGRIAVVSGRPGSGKTSIVASLLRVLARLGDPPLESMALAAPTGKAADRMRQSISRHLAGIAEPGEADRRLAEACPSSSTLHRLLGYSPVSDRFRHDENNPLSEKLIIVDESSMVDLSMMDRLLRATAPDARLVLIGDADQLPSVEAGAVLRDLSRAPAALGAGRVAVLKKSYRAREEDSGGRRILDVASAINEGRSPEEAGGGRSMVRVDSASRLAFEGVEHLAPGTAGQRSEFLSRWSERLGSLPHLEERLRTAYPEGPGGFDEETTRDLSLLHEHFESHRILCATRVPAGGAGSGAINAYFHARRVERMTEQGRGRGAPHFLVGEPVLVTRNDYTLRLYNGDSGLVLLVAPSTGTRARSAEPMAVFPRSGGFVAFPLEALRGKLDLAWATTVHKSQGSEYDHVVLILPEAPVRTLTRELLYTAVTRAKRSVAIVGSRQVLQAGVTRAMDRESGLSDMLA